MEKAVGHWGEIKRLKCAQSCHRTATRLAWSPPIQTGTNKSAAARRLQIAVAPKLMAIELNPITS